MIQNSENRILSASDLEQIQTYGLQWTVRHAYENSSFYREQFRQNHLDPDEIHTLEDLRKLPFTTAEHFREDYPFPLLSVPHDQVLRIHASSGTTGRRKIVAYTHKDIQDWTNMFRRCFQMAGVGPGDRVQMAVGYGLWTAGAGFQAGCEAAGAMAIPVGPGNVELQCRFLVDLQPSTICCTSSMALLLGEEIKRRGIKEKIAIKRIIQGSERCSDAMRRAILEHFGADHLFDITGMTELYGPGAGIDCHEHQGIHYWADYYILEILNPQTLEPVADGEIGEMVITTLHKEATPLIRYRTRDLTRKISGQCACGSPYPRHDRILGRSDDMIIFRGVNIYPGLIDEILSGMPGIASEYNIFLEHRDGRDYMTLKVERSAEKNSGDDKDLALKISRSIKSSILVSAKVQIVDYNTLPRSEKKSKRIFDRRQTAGSQQPR